MLLLFLLPALLYVTAWRIIPALYTAYLSFTSYNLAYDPSLHWVGFARRPDLLVAADPAGRVHVPGKP